MVKVLPAVFSYEDMKRRFAQDNPDEPYTRRKDLETGLYALDNWLIRVNDEDKTISTVGWKEHPSHTTVGGMYATAEGRQIGGNNRALQDAREPQLNQSKPLVAAFGHRDGDNARWIATAKKNGWAFPDSENWEQMKQLLPESVVNEWNSAYPNGNWAIRNIRGKGEFAKCVYLDDLTPSWFNLLKYLPDNTWDDFELGEPAPDLGTRDRFKDKNIKSKGKAEYKAFVSQQYLRQVSDRIPNAGTSLMQGWLEKLTEMNLKKGKYWFFGTNVKQDNTYVMIDVIKQGEPYTPNADKKLNLEGFETAIIFTGVSKEMVGKVKRGQGIPKGRKFLDIHGKYGVRGLKRGRRLPKEPKNIFPTFEKSWKDVLKWRPDGSFSSQGPSGKFVPADKRTGTGGKYSSVHNTMITGHYQDKGYERGSFRNFLWLYFDRTDMIEEWVSLLRQQPDDLLTAKPKNKIWFYCVSDKNDLSHVEARVILPRGDMLEKRFVFDSIRIKDPNTNTWMQPPSYAQFIDIWNSGVKPETTISASGDTRNVFNIGQQKRAKTGPSSIFDSATTGDQAFETWKSYRKKTRAKIQKLKNKREKKTRPTDKDRLTSQIQSLESEYRRKYKEYKKAAMKLPEK